MIGPWHRPRNIGLALLGLCAVAGAGVAIYQKLHDPPKKPPKVEFSGVDPLVVRPIESARAAVEADPKSGPAWGKLGMLLFAHDYHAEALQCFAEAERLDPSDGRWPYYSGMILKAERPDEAITAFQRAAERDKSFAAHLRLAELLLAQERPDEAEAAYQKAGQGLAEARALLGLGKIALRRGDAKQARPYLETATRSPEARREASVALVEVLQELGDQSAAERLQSDIAHMPPDAPWPDPHMAQITELQTGTRARLNQVNGLLRANRVPEALNIIQQILRDDPNSELGQLALGRALMQANDPRAAESAMAALVRQQPGCIDGHLLRGAAQMAMAGYEDAVGSFRRVIELNPAHALAHLNLARCLRKTGDKPGARRAFADAVRCKPDLLAAHVEFAEFLLEQGDRPGALERLHDAQRLAPEDKKVKRLLAEATAKP